ncbi:MAG: hypothetical protein AAF601_03965 [Pseudomonadota bacterium]
MRPTTVAAGLILISGAAFAGASDHFAPDPSQYVSLDNGCVYGPSLLGTENEWALVYSQAGPTVICELTVYDISDAPGPVVVATAVQPTETLEPRAVTQAPTAPLKKPPLRPRIKLGGGFLVGVFR